MPQNLVLNPFHRLHPVPDDRYRSLLLFVDPRGQVQGCELTDTITRVAGACAWEQRTIAELLAMAVSADISVLEMEATIEGLFEMGLLVDTDPFEVLGDLRQVELDEAFVHRHTASYLKAAVALGLRFQLLDEATLHLQPPRGGEPLVISERQVGPPHDNAIRQAHDKGLANACLRSAGIPVPKQHVFASHEFADAWKRLEPLRVASWVVKPRWGSRGFGVTVGVSDSKQLEQALAVAFNQQGQVGDVLVEERLLGEVHRVWVACGAVVGVFRHDPPRLTGTGTHTIEALIDSENRARGGRHHQLIDLNPSVTRCLAGQGLALDSVPAAGRRFRVNDLGNVSQGANPVDVTDEMCAAVEQICIRAAEALSLPVCGIDILTDDITAPLDAGEGIIEVNSQPGVPAWHEQWPIDTFVAKGILEQYFAVMK